AGEVKVRVAFAGLNFAEVSARQGIYPDAPPSPFVAGYEASGVVEALGAGVTGLAVGDRVVALTRFGGHAEVVCAPAVQVLKLPASMSFEQGAALPVNYLTAYHMLFRVAGLRPGQSVLVHMAAGGVGLAVLQLCRTVERVTVFGTASASKHDVLREQGCAHPIDYRTTDYAEEVRRRTGGKGVDIVLDPLGGNDWKKGYGLLRPAGKLVAYGFANMQSGERRSLLTLASQAVKIPIYTPLKLMDDNRSVAGVNVGHLWNEAELLREELEALLALFELGQIKPRIDEIFPFDRAAEAHGRLEQRKNIGKVLLRP
ncbi:MAG: alcohol dehydrogenase, partial [Myxococcales bacterium]